MIRKDIEYFIEGKSNVRLESKITSTDLYTFMTHTLRFYFLMCYCCDCVSFIFLEFANTFNGLFCCFAESYLTWALVSYVWESFYAVCNMGWFMSWGISGGLWWLTLVIEKKGIQFIACEIRKIKCDIYQVNINSSLIWINM